MPNARDRLLQRAHETRAKAAQARDLLRYITQSSVCEELVDYAKQLDGQADELERQANAPAPVVPTRQAPVQMQQAQATRPKGNEPE